MLRTTEHENGQTIPSREGHWPSGPGVGYGVGNGPTPALRDRCRSAPPLQGGDFHGRTARNQTAHRSDPRLDPARSSSSTAGFTYPAAYFLEGLHINVTKFAGTVRPNVEREDVAALHPVSIELHDLLGR
jgi:hypothetical protein